MEKMRLERHLRVILVYFSVHTLPLFNNANRSLYFSLSTTYKSYIFAPIHFSLITHHFFIIYLVILQMNEHIRLNAQKNVRGGVQNKQLQEINKP